MRTVSGPQQVDVVYRRVDDMFLDPDELHADSSLGVRGLMRAWRAGNVAIANAPGAGVADDKVVYAWVPDIIRYYLDEEPILPNVPTYRCLYDDERKYVLDHLARPGHQAGQRERRLRPRRRRPRPPTSDLAGVARAIEADPRRWVAQPILALSTAPTLVDEGVEARHVDLRPFILTGRSSYVTRGGLTTRGAAEGFAGRELVAGRRQQGHLGGRVLTAPRPAGPQTPMLLSRVAEHLYWAARYLERAEDTARVIAEHTHLLVDLPTSVPLTWEPLLAVTGSGAAFRERYTAADEHNIITFLLADRENSSSVVSSVVAARENLRTTREVIPREAWQALNDLYLYATSHHTEAVDRRSRGPLPRQGHRRVPAVRGHRVGRP